jgi:hypothetical protein
MAFNKSPLGGSPLGLIGTRSYFGDSGISTFNGGKSRNIQVLKYNRNDADAGMISGNSLFTGSRLVRAWPELHLGGNSVTGGPDTGGPDKKNLKGEPRRELHNNSVYDVSILNIIEKLAGTKASLRPADFAYLKNIGVLPNNRLMIARRFANPSEDNIMVPSKNELGSFATLISWVPENTDFLEFTFGEEWTDSEADFKTILTALGEDIGLGNLGSMAGAGGNALPLPGFTEIFQRQFLAGLGLIENSKKNSIPAGNPNLIKQSKRRKVIGYGEAGSGLKTAINIKMVCEYELKYISGIDPTIVWMDLLGMIMRFGTSNSDTYGLTKGAAAKLKNWANNPNELISDVAKALSLALGKIVQEIRDAVTDVYNKAVAANAKIASSDPVAAEPAEAPNPQAADKKLFEEAKTAGMAFADKIWEALKGYMGDALSGLLQKYRVKIIGVVNSLANLPSTPWHITIGNPMRPIFCSGDMLCDVVTLTLGPNLSFNDLPSSIKVEFNLVNAKPLGLQQIMAKFNSGYLRTVDVQKTWYETNTVEGVDGKMYIENVGTMPLQDIVYGTAGSSGTSGSNGTGGSNVQGVNNTNNLSGSTGTGGSSGTGGSNKVEGTGQTNQGDLNSDPNGIAINQTNGTSGPLGSAGTGGSSGTGGSNVTSGT